MKRIMLIDDYEPTINMIKYGFERLSKKEIEIIDFASVDEAIKYIESQKVDGLILDIGMPGKDGFQFLRHLEKKGIRIPSVIITGYGKDSTPYQESLETELDVFHKPFDVEKLVLEMGKLVYS